MSPRRRSRTSSGKTSSYAIIRPIAPSTGSRCRRLPDLLAGRVKGRESDSQITGFVNNLGMGAQFAAVGKKVYDAAKAKGAGREVPLDWFTQDVHP